ncbi:MAG TPA: sulfotransferase [Candidatus Nanopelagicales bacterium]|nr:sulfotransferase [Candidatus Nanopelagicales bacterium]
MTDRWESPVLVGGTGRSGSTIVGHLLDHHPGLTLTRPMEVRFITGNDGLADALAIGIRKPGSAKAQAAAELALDRMLNRWFERAENVGLHTSMPREDVATLGAAYLSEFREDPRAATCTLTRAVMARVATNINADRWVDTTPANARKADRVEPIYPESTVVIVHRDGRDVAASFTQQSFGPDDVFDALEQWGQRMLRIHRAVQASRPDRIVEIDLVDLVDRNRYDTVARICAAIEVDVPSTLLTWFDENVTSAGAHHGRWRQQFSKDVCRRIDARYQQICEHLMEQGVRIPPAGA